MEEDEEVVDDAEEADEDEEKGFMPIESLLSFNILFVKPNVSASRASSIDALEWSPAGVAADTDMFVNERLCLSNYLSLRIETVARVFVTQLRVGKQNE